jgi:hypothetical protein
LADKTDPFKIAEELKALFEKYPELPRATLAERMGISTQRISDWLALNNTIEPIRELFRKGEIGRIICVRAGYLSQARQVNYVERITKRRLLPPTDHLLSLYIPNDGQDRAKHMVAKIGHEPVSARIHSDDNPTPGEILDFAFNITGVTLTWRFADANQMMLAVQDALAMGLLNGLPNQKMAKVV